MHVCIDGVWEIFYVFEKKKGGRVLVWVLEVLISGVFLVLEGPFYLFRFGAR